MLGNVMKQIICMLLAGLSLISCELYAGNVVPDNLPELMSEATVTRYPDADVVLLADLTSVTYKTDGTYVQRSESFQKILTERGRKERRTYTIPYNEIYSRIKPILAEIIREDGTKQPIDLTTQVSIATENSSMAANIYSSKDKVLTINIPDVKIGDVLHLSYENTLFKPRVPDFFADIVLFEYTMPICYVSYEVISPAELPLLHAVVRNPRADAPVIAQKQTLPDGRTRHVWTARNIPQAYPEPNMPTLYTQVQRVIVSTGKDWEALSKWYWDLCAPHLKPNAAMTAKVKELIAGVTDFDDKVAKIFHFVSQEIRYMGIIAEDTAPGYEPHDATLTFDNRYGVCRDKAALLAVMLREAGLEGFPVLINAGTKLDAEIPSPFFNHAITAVRRPDGSYLLMDATDESTRDIFPAYLSDCDYLVATPQGGTLTRSPVRPAKENLLKHTTAAELSTENVLSVTSTLDFGGINDNIYRQIFISYPLEQQQKLLDGILRNILPGADFTGFTVSPKDPQDMTQPLKLTLNAQIKDYAVINADGVALIRLPWISKGMGYVNFIANRLSLDKRRFDMTLNTTAAVTESLTITGLDTLGQVLYLPADQTLASPGVRYTRGGTINAGSFTGKREMAFTQMTYTPEDYLKLRTTLEGIQKDTRREPMFTKSITKNADSEVLSAHTTIELDTMNSYTIRHRESRRILTYQGKKDHAESFFSYIPARETFQLVTAETLTADGKTLAVTEKEINTMDADWVAGAPRYPVQKTMVVNFPSVEENTTITYETVREVKNVPTFSYEATPQRTDPVKDFSLTIKVPLALTDFYDASTRELSTPLTLTTTSNDTHMTYTWRAHDLKALPKEEMTPKAYHYLTQALFHLNCSPDRENDDPADRTQSLLLTEWQDLCTAVEGAVSVAMESESIRALTAEVTEGRSGNDALIAIRDAVAQRIRAAGPSFMSLPRWVITPATTTLAEGYGNALDRIILLQAMCRLADFPSDIILVNPIRNYPDAVVAGMYSPTTAYSIPLVQIKTDPSDWRNDPVIYLGDTNNYAHLGTTSYDEHIALNMTKTLIMHKSMTYADIPSIWMETAYGDTTQTTKTRTVNINLDGSAQTHTETIYEGTAYNRLNQTYSQMQPEDRRRHELDLVNNEMQGASLLGAYSVQHKRYPGSTTLAISAPSYATRDGKIMTIPVKELPKRLFPLRGKTRTAPIFLSDGYNTTTVTTWFLPKETKRILMKPESYRWEIRPIPHSDSPWMQLSISWEEERDPFTGLILLTCTMTYEPTSGVVQPIFYPTLLEMNRLLAHPAMANIVIELHEEEVSK